MPVPFVPDIADWFDALPAVDRIVPDLIGAGSPALTVVIVATAVLSAWSVALALMAVAYHVEAGRRRRLWERDAADWRALLLDVLAGERPVEALVAAVGPSEERRFLAFLVPYATTIRGSEAQTLRELAEPFLPAVEANLTSPRPPVRAQAVYRIGLLGGRDRAPLLRDALEDESDYVVQVAVRRLARIGVPADAARIVDRLHRLRHANRLQITSALVDFGDPAAPEFRRGLDDARRPTFVRVVCAETLRWLADPDAAPVAARLLGRPSGRPSGRPALDPELVAALLRLLRRVGGPRHARVVRPHCASEVDFVRIHAARALGRLGGGGDADRLGRMVREDPSRWVALSAARGLLELDRTAPLRALRGADHERSAMAADLLPTPT
jgi:HEAT repeat protein